MSAWSIEFVEGERKGQRMPLGGRPLALGRSSKAGLSFSAPDVSGLHLQLEVRGANLVLTQTGSGKTWLKSDVVAPGAERVLDAGDVVAFAGGNAFVVECEDEMESVTDDEMPTDAGDGALATLAERTGGSATFMTSGATAMTAGVPAKTSPTLPPKPLAAKKKPAAPPPPVEDDDDEGKTGTSTGTQDADDETMAMATRAISAEEEQKLRFRDKSSAKKRLYRMVGAGIGVVALLGGAWWFSLSQVETELSWPVDAKGEEKYFNKWIYLDENWHGAGQAEEFGFYAPGNAALKVEEQGMTTRITTRIGKREDVTCRVILERNQAAHHLLRGREEGFRQWCERKAEENSGWKSIDPVQEFSFLGNDHGIPYQTAEYFREDSDGAWFGILHYLKIRDWEIVLLKEVPEAEGYRAKGFLFQDASGRKRSFFLQNPATAFVTRYWEPEPKALDGAPGLSDDDMLAEVEKWLMRDEVPGKSLVNVRRQLTRALTWAYLKGDEDSYKRGMAMLTELRQRQVTVHNQKLINIRFMRAAHEEKRADALLRELQDMFSDESDQRYRSVRRINR